MLIAKAANCSKGSVFRTMAAGLLRPVLYCQNRPKTRPKNNVAITALQSNRDSTLNVHEFLFLEVSPFNSQTPNGACVIVLHGVSDSKASSAGFAPMFLAHGYSVLAPDSRAHGESGGNFVTYGSFERYDVVRWAHWMQSHGCRRIFGLGESLGASILIQATAVEPVFNAIVAESPYADLQRMARYRLEQRAPLPGTLSRILSGWVVKTGLLYAKLFEKLDFSQVTPLESLHASATPVLLIHGVNDTRTPPDESQRLAAVRTNQVELWLVPNGGHTDASSVAPTEFQKRVLGWFSKH